jgi:CarD family transcriptional regulator
MATAKAGTPRTPRAQKGATSGPAPSEAPAGAHHETELKTIETRRPAKIEKSQLEKHSAPEADVAEAAVSAVEPADEELPEVVLTEADLAVPDLTEADVLAAADIDISEDTLDDLSPAGPDAPEALAVAAEDGIDEEDLVADLDTVVVAEDEEEEDEDEGLPPPSNRVAPRMPGHMPGVPNRPVMHARMPAKAEVFHEGDHVVYPTHGGGKVERIATEEIAGHKLELIHITFEENRMTLRVPVSKARSAGLRKLATRKMFDEAMAILKGRARIKRTMWSRRAQEYEAKINSGDPLAIAEVVRDLHRNSGQPDQSFSERQIYEAAMDRLAAELAALDKTDKPTAVTKLGDFLKTV